MSDARDRGVPEPGMSAYRYHLHEHEKKRVDNYFEPGMPRAFLERHDDFGSWTILVDSPDRVLMRHYNGAMMWVDVEGDQAMSYEIIEGDEARALDAEHGEG
jgi:hypothetical protein